MIQQALEVCNSMIERLVPFILEKRSKKSYIGIAISIVILQQIYSYNHVPKKLRGFPKVSFFSMLKALLTNESVSDRTKRLVTPLTNKGHKFYLSKIPLKWTLIVADPVAAKTLLMKTDNFPKSHEIFKKLYKDGPTDQFLGRENVVISNGEVWKRQRKVMNPAFHRALPVKTFGRVMLDLFALIDQENDHVPITIRMQNFTLDALGFAAFGFDFQSLKGDPEEWTKTYNIVFASLANLFFNLIPPFLIKYISPKTVRATERFYKMLENLVDTRREEIRRGEKSHIPDNEKDLLTLMIEADMEAGTQVTSVELRQNVAVFFLAGHDTTAHSLTFALYHLAKNKHVQRKARQEILNILGDDAVDVQPSLEELNQMEYLMMIIKENLRINGPVDVLFSRRSQEEIVLADTVIPKDIEIAVDAAAIHLNPKIWANPNQFIPERFEEGGEHENHSTGYAWIPFSGGSRICLGKQFSLTEQRVVLSMLLKRYEIDISKDSEHYEKIIFDKPFNFAPNSLQLKFTRRY